MVNIIFVNLQLSSSPTIIAIQIIASLLTILLGGVQLYDYLSEEDVSNRGSTHIPVRSIDGSTAPLLDRIQHEEKVRYLTISLFSFVTLSVSAIVSNIIILYISVVIVAQLLLTERSKKAEWHEIGGDLSFMWRFVLSNIIFVVLLWISVGAADSATAPLTVTKALSGLTLLISLVFLPAAVWFAFASFIKIYT